MTTPEPRYKKGDQVCYASHDRLAGIRQGEVTNTSEPAEGRQWRYYVLWDNNSGGILAGNRGGWEVESKLRPVAALEQLAEVELEKWYVYVLLSESSGRSYVGVTTDLKRRIRQHNGTTVGGAKSTRAGRPWASSRVLGPFTNRAEAQRIEYRLKQERGHKARMEWSPKGMNAP